MPTSSRRTCRALKVLAVPTMVIFRGGVELGRMVGARSEAEVRTLFEEALAHRARERRSLAAADRLMRLAIGGLLVALGLLSGPALILVAAGGLVSFAAIADRCPVWQAIRPRLAALLGRGDTAAPGV